jgi:hypothetical protein
LYDQVKRAISATGRTAGVFCRQHGAFLEPWHENKYLWRRQIQKKIEMFTEIFALSMICLILVIL